MAASNKTTLNISGSFPANDSFYNYTPAVLSSGMWTAEIAVNSIVIIIGLILITLVLLTYASDTRLYRNHFHIYVTNLLISDFLYFTGFIPLSIFLNAYPTVIYPVWVCPIFDYFLYAASMLQPFSHFLISLNRIWALVLPQSYKTRHSRKIAALQCLLIALVAHVVGLPPVLIEYFRYGQTRLPGCNVDVWDTTIAAYGGLGLVLTFLCEIFVIGSYPVLLHRQRTRMATTASRSETSNQTGRIQSYKLKAISNSGSSSEQPKEVVERERKTSGHAFKALSWLVVGVLLGWTPSFVYTGYFTFSVDAYDPNIMEWMSFLTNLQIMCDPLIFLLALKDLKKSFKRLFC